MPALRIGAVWCNERIVGADLPREPSRRAAAPTIKLIHYGAADSDSRDIITGDFLNLEAFSIVAREMLVHAAVLEAFGLRIEFQGASDAERDIAEVAMSTGDVRVEDRHRGVGLLARSHRRDEALECAALVAAHCIAG